MLLLLDKDSKLRRPEDVDKIISAELPDKSKFPELYAIITQTMIHGPCGHIDRRRPCMEGKTGDEPCQKGFPKQFNNTATTLSDNIYANYLRRDSLHGGQETQRTVNGKNYVIDNRWVVPYSPKLSYLMNAHVNVEIVISVKAVKYLYKYITKGSDKILFATTREDGVLDEITNFATARYIGATEAFWRLYGFEIVKRYPSVFKLALHLPNQQFIIFEEGQEQETIESGPPNTTLTAYFELNKIDPSAQMILYPDICQTYRFISGKWVRRKRNNAITKLDNKPPSDTVGRIPIITLNPKQSELFYLRMLLYHVPGAQDFEDLKKFNGILCDTFQDACRRRGLLSDDSEIDRIITEGASIRFGTGLRDLFASVLACANPSNPVEFWARHRDTLSEDFAHAAGRSYMPNADDYSAALAEIRDLLNNMEMSLENDFGIIIPNSSQTSNAQTVFDTDFLSAYADENYNKMTVEQRSIFNQVIESVDNASGTTFSLNAAGGTGKTFVLKTILAKVRSQNQVAVATAISGIAAILLPQGRTLHSKLKPPIDITEYSTCNIPANSALAQELRVCKILIIDEITMAKRQVFEAVERSLRDIRNCDSLFGGITTVLTGDWRQILPVVKHGSKAEIISSCLKQSQIWRHITELKLTKNMRLDMDSPEESEAFAQFLLKVGDGTIDPVSDDEPEFIQVPQDLLLPENSLDNLCDFTYGDLIENMDSNEWLCERTILSVTNENTETVNKKILERSPANDNIRKSADVIIDDALARCYPTEFLNTLNPSGMPPHVLNLKIGSPVMLIRNLDTVKGHCNGTRYVITQCHQYVIEATVISGLNIGARKMIPRIPITCTDKSLPFTFKRTQFPVKTCYGMTINKSQGQSLKRVGLYLERDVFAHGQLYVAMSRVTDRRNLKIVYPDGNDGKIRNVVYREVL